MQPHTPAAATAPGEHQAGPAGARAPGQVDLPGAAAERDLEVDLCIIGGGTGGMAVAATAAAFGRSVVLIEKHRTGGSTLNSGSVPSKALIAAARRARLVRTSGAFGIRTAEPVIDPKAVHEHVRESIAAVAPNASRERLAGLGVRVIDAAGRFADPGTVVAGEHRIKARRFVVATGSSPLIPPIPGLDGVPYFTTETIFDNAEGLPHLVVIGGGSTGLEVAQAYHRLGSRVTVLERHKALGEDDPELTAILLQELRKEGLDIREGAVIERVEGTAGDVRIHVAFNDGRETVRGTHLLVAAGRKPNISGLGLVAAGIKYDERGITVDSGLVTSNGKVFAIGDVVGGPRLTHMADYHAGLVVRRALFRLPAKVKGRLVSWVTHTDPELAHAGLTEEQARRAFGRVNALRWPYHENDRAHLERATVGHVKVVTSARGRILGATIVGAGAGELIQIWSLAISRKLRIEAMTGWISPYPSLAEINKRAAYRYYASAPSNPLVRKAIGFLARFG